MTNNLSTTHPVKKQPSDNKNWEAHACTNPGNGMGETARKYREKRAARASELNGQEKTHSSEQISRHNCAERRLREHSSTSTREHMKSKMNIRRTLLTLMYLPRKKDALLSWKSMEKDLFTESHAKPRKRASTNTVKQVHILIYAVKHSDMQL